MRSNDVHAWSGRHTRCEAVLQRALVLSLCALVTAIVATAQQSQSIGVGVGYTTKPQEPYPTDGLVLAQPTFGLFIGISDYDDRAKVQPTPAHTLGAALMYDAFFNAAKRLESKRAGIPADNYAKIHETAVCSVTFSPSRSRFPPAAADGTIMVNLDNRTRFTTGSADGTVALWSIDPLRGNPRMEGTLTTNGADSCAVAFSPDASNVAIAEKGGDVSIRPVSGTGQPKLLKHSASVCSVAFDSSGTQILTTSSDGTARVWDAAAQQTLLSMPPDPECPPARPGKPSCADAPVAAFSPREKLVVTSSCGATRTWPIESPAAPALIGKGTNALAISFSPDGSRILMETADDVNLRPTHPGEKSSGVLSNPNGRHARFSPDGSYLVTAEKNGAINAFETGTMKTHASLGRIITGVRSLQFSGDSRYIAITSDNGSVWLQDVNGQKRPRVVPRPEEPTSQFDDNGSFAIDMAIKFMTLPPGRKETPLQSMGISPDGRYVVGGYKDGTVGIHAGMSLPEEWTFHEEDETLLADHQFDNTPLSIMAIWYLRQLQGAGRQLSLAPSESPTPRDEPSALRVGKGKPVTRERVFDELQKTIRRSEASTGENQTALLVVYVAAHGWLGPDGRTYFLPSDADAEQPNTWIAYEEFLKPIKDFVSASPLSRGAVVVFDTCQVPLGTAAKPTAAPGQLPEYLLVIESTSPNQYAWHWTGHMDSSERVTTFKSKTQFGIQRKAKPVDEKLDASFPARMSIFPVASQWALSDLIDAKSAASDPDGRVISAGDWIVNTRLRLARLLEGIPEVSHGYQQEMQVRPPNGPNFRLFEVEPGARKK
jgi:WD40 repeat protein